MNGKFTSYPVIAVLIMLFIGMFMSFLTPTESSAEFYSYEDSDGVIHFVDDASNIPKEYRKKVQVRKDENDDLTAEERQHLLEMERQKRAEEQEHESEQQEQARAKRAEENRKAEEERLATKVLISGRQVFVPVKLSNGTAETDVLLLLDTGASVSLITAEVADRLKITETDKIRIGVVGGRSINARRVLLSYMEVGPVKKENQEVVIVQQHFAGDGLLGMSFLGGLKYTIDFENQTIKWSPR